MPGTLHLFELLSQTPQELPNGLCPVFGTERFLKQLAVKHLVGMLGDGDSDFSATHFDGTSATWADVNDELSTRSLFGGDGPRIVVVDYADAFVKQFRGQIESLQKTPPANSLLILIVDSWLTTTNLYKRIHKSGLQVLCSSPTKGGRSKQRDDAKVIKWLVDRAQKEYDFVFQASGATVLIELTECNFGRMDQELAKLCLYAGDMKLTPLKVREIVGGWPAQTMWAVIDSATDGNAGGAIGLVDQLIRAGEHPLALFGQLAWALRRFAEVGEIVTRDKRNQRRIDLNAALKQAGFRAWGGEIENAGRRLKQLGRARVAKINDWLLELDLQLKRTHSQSDRGRLAIELLLVKMAAELSPAASR